MIRTESTVGGNGGMDRWKRAGGCMENEKTRERDKKRELHELPYTQMVKSRTILLTSGKLPKFLNYTYSMCIIGEVAVFGYYLPTVLKTKDTLITSTDSVLSSPPPSLPYCKCNVYNFGTFF